MNRFNRETVRLLLQYLPARDALSLRACCRDLNKLVSTSQLYWWYQNNPPPAVKVHNKLFSRHCISGRTGQPNFAAIYQHLLDNYDDDGSISAYYHHIIKNYALSNPMRDVAFQFFDKIDHKFCGYPHHFDEVIPDRVAIDLETAEFKLVSDADEHGLQMYHFLFSAYHRIRKTLKRYDSDRAYNEATALRQKITLLESKIREVKAQLYVIENCDDLSERENRCPFKRKSARNYHRTQKTVNSLLTTGGEKKKRKRSTAVD